MEKDRQKRRFPIDLKKIGFVVAGVILFLLIMDLNAG
jgi:hypothetical protein